MTILPAIDIKKGRCVRLLQGLADMETEYFEDPVEPAKEFLAAGAEWVHVVDLDGAFTGKPANTEAARKIAELGMKVEFGGGIREMDDIRNVLKAGVTRVVVGTRACESLDFVKAMAQEFGPQVAVGIDARAGKVAVHGWVDTTDMPAIDLAQQVAAAGIQTIIYTDIMTDGMMRGPNFEGMKEMWTAVDCDVIASGGVADLHDVVHYADLAPRFPNFSGVIIGKAIYEKAIDLKQALSIASRVGKA
ncbi:1-(5-phosphoribosyl)-5-[(5-phosphoribosylamino)methylideneamino]imidazole-4-carboxamide isomerase [Cerasicoccus arenae]|uniref:1-(5-phosphoribosyl)-5-[(5-phosphoribosylamino)methylideneamino] imidazole-4-carboxamide isomerase n=1 Tax=Cerasicoccus arenae TaxID=424488 RepID=A0A8J3GD78_9BACT|nr:1-(5-phosphoribosyl)-5-[(5-phosphoribosylamino)methylideneamino]imidazole-4-carboxamide isomerase [Cerasicoccus arenae]MBK1856901.1 1-(5-phosphoribosyl)-5-[(5-phosphoribosylamino)methylideneamino]imidazole-4-carboxamide isomerase [Cerasicoccus arenae]GHB89747.1 1-(5-phosphoribosyl)-5-[(5-phosphoribosylamino) methylideneamino] imidazole-4-carboxamide isomerase [Cerasicoccus arenae]